MKNQDYISKFRGNDKCIIAGYYLRKKIKLIIFLGVLISLVSCKTSQNIISETVTNSISTPETETIVVESDSLSDKKGNYDWISYRGNISVESNNFNVFVVNRRDSIIYLTVSKLGIEGVRLVLTPDTAKFLNHLASNYYVGDYVLLEKWTGFNVDFYMLQSLLAGEELPEHAKSFIQASYGNFTTIDSYPFFQHANFVIPKEDLQLNIQIKSIKRNEAGPTSIRIPEKYKPMNF